jgi:hypothetical protein
MSAIGNGRRSNVALAVLTGILVLADAGLAALGALVWRAHQRGDLTGSEAATFALLGVSAAVGAAVLLVAAGALVRGVRGHRLAGFTSVVSWLRVVAVVIALMVITIRLGTSAVAGLLETFGAVIAVGEALMVVFVSTVAVRRTRR